MIQKIFHNWPLKLLSVVLAVIVWLIIMSLADPTDTKTIYNIPVRLLNMERLTQAGKSYKVVGGDSPTTNVRVSAAGSVLREISASDFIATADIEQMIDVSGAVEINVTCTDPRISNGQITKLVPSVRIDYESIISKDFTVSVSETGELPEGYFIDRETASPRTIRVTGPESVVSRIGTVQAPVDLSDLTESVEKESVLQFYSDSGQPINLASQRDTSVSVDKVNLKIEVSTMKNLPVVIANAVEIVKTQVPEGYRYTGSTQSLTSVQVRGLKSRLADISMLSIPEDAFDLRNATESKTFNLDLNAYLPEGIKLMDGQENILSVVLEVEKLVVREFEVRGLVLNGQKDGFRYEYNPLVKVYLEALEDDFIGFDPGSLSLEAELGEYATVPGIRKLDVKVSCTDYIFTPLNRSYVTVTIIRIESDSDSNE